MPTGFDHQICLDDCASLRCLTVTLPQLDPCHLHPLIVGTQANNLTLVERRIALDHRHMLKIVGQHAGRAQAGHTAANHDGMLVRWIVEARATYG
jgi:hypothetical protein